MNNVRNTPTSPFVMTSSEVEHNTQAGNIFTLKEMLFPGLKIQNKNLLRLLCKG